MDSAPKPRLAADEVRAQSATGIPSTLCGGRPRCEVHRTRTADGVRVVDLLLHVHADAGTDECNRREYWRLKEGEPARLLAVDCDEQRSAEEAAAATTDIAHGAFVVDYVEIQASDHCQRYQARLDLTTLEVAFEARWNGTTDARGCRTTKRIKKMAPKGDGARDKPILRLHTEWADINGGQ